MRRWNCFWKLAWRTSRPGCCASALAGCRRCRKKAGRYCRPTPRRQRQRHRQLLPPRRRSARAAQETHGRAHRDLVAHGPRRAALHPALPPLLQHGRGNPPAAGKTLRELHFARRRSTGTLMLWRTCLEVVPRNKSARNRCPCVLIATKSHPFCLTHLTISFGGSP